jgi:hypothetical protein
MNKDLIDLVQSLGGNATLGGIPIQFSDTAFQDAVKKIYEMGVEAEREACAQLCDELFADVLAYSAPDCSAAIRARK